MDYNLLKVFSKVAELGSFTKASQVLKQPKSRVSRAISRLERDLGVQLLRRTTRKSSLTLIGQDLHQSIYPLLASIAAELTRVSNLQNQISGVIRLTASEDIGQTLLSQVTSVFIGMYPDVQIETLITSNFLDLTKENIDIAFRAGKLADSSLKQKKILNSSFIIVASKQYVTNYGCPQKTEDLVDHRVLSFKGREKSFFTGIDLKPRIISDSIPMLVNMVMQGDGIALLPDFYCKQYLDANLLVHLLPSWKSKAEGIHILYPPSKTLSKKVKTYMDLASELVSQP